MVTQIEENGQRIFIITGDGRVQGLQPGDGVIWDGRKYVVTGDGRLWRVQE